jgi:hypothetical protein
LQHPGQRSGQPWNQIANRRPGPSASVQGTACAICRSPSRLVVMRLMRVSRRRFHYRQWTPRPGYLYPIGFEDRRSRSLGVFPNLPPGGGDFGRADDRRQREHGLSEGFSGHPFSGPLRRSSHLDRTGREVAQILQIPGRIKVRPNCHLDELVIARVGLRGGWRLGSAGRQGAR